MNISIEEVPIKDVAVWTFMSVSTSALSYFSVCPSGISRGMLSATVSVPEAISEHSLVMYNTGSPDSLISSFIFSVWYIVQSSKLVLGIRIAFYGHDLSLMKTQCLRSSHQRVIKFWVWRNLGKFLYMIKIMTSIKAFKLQYYMPNFLLPCIILWS